MNKPKNKAEWISAAKSLGVTVEKPDTVKEIKKNIADKLGVSARGKNYETRLVVAMHGAINTPAPIVPPSTKNTSASKPAKKGSVKLKFEKLLYDREHDVCLKFKKGEVWLNKKDIELVSVSEVEVPDWLAELKKIV